MVRRSLDWIGAANAWLATKGFGTLDVEPASESIGIIGNQVGDLLVSVILIAVSRYLSFRKDR